MPGWLELKFWQTSFMLPFLTGVCLLPPITASFCLLRFVFVSMFFVFIPCFISCFYVSFFSSVCLLPPITSGCCLLGFVFFSFFFGLIFCYNVFPSHWCLSLVANHIRLFFVGVFSRPSSSVPTYLWDKLIHSA